MSSLEEPVPRRAIALRPDACTACMICVRECPAWCIEIDSHIEEVSDPGARRPRTVNVLDRFSLDFGLCMYCDICVEVCPFDALAWVAQPVPPTESRTDLAYDTQRLAALESGR